MHRNIEEIVVADGGSRDATVSIARRREVEIISSPPRGARQLNQGDEHVTADCLLFLHADTRLPEAAAAIIREAFAAGTLLGRFDVRIEGWHPLFPIIANPCSRSLPTMASCCALSRKETSGCAFIRRFMPCLTMTAKRHRLSRDHPALLARCDLALGQAGVVMLPALGWQLACPQNVWDVDRTEDLQKLWAAYPTLAQEADDQAF